MIKSPTRPWKHTLTTTPTCTENSLVSLYDLFYDPDGNFWINSEDPMAGTALEHDIICLNSSMLKSDNSVDQSQTATIETSLWWTYGIDVSIPIFDARARRKVMQCNAAIGASTELPVFINNRYTIYDKDSALEPVGTDVFTAHGVMSNLKSGALSWENYLPPSILPFTPGAGASGNNADIILSAPDKAFKSTLVMQDGMSSYNRIFINPYTWFAVSLVIKATGMNSNNLLSTTNFLTPTSIKEIFGSYENFWSTKDVKGTFVAGAVNLGGNSSTMVPTSPEVKDTYDGSRWKELLKNTFVWVRAPFFADYVKPEDFDQDLNQDAKVIHSELMLSGAADFKKYDVFSTATAYYDTSGGLSTTNATPGLGTIAPTDVNGVGMSELSMPYVPKTSPTVDIYTSKLLDKDTYLKGLKQGVSDDSTNYSSKIAVSQSSNQIENFIENEASGNNPIVRGLPVAAINRTNAKSTPTTESLIPPNWFDPENYLSDDDYKNMTKFPSVVPKDGNLYVDGRIIGPTIDEIWIMLKKLTGGRLSDVNSIDRAGALDMGVPKGDGYYENDTDTTMTEVPDSEFNFKYSDDGISKYGDPIDFQYKPTSDTADIKLFDQKLSVTKFVNQNNKITYPIYSSLKLLSDDIVANVQDGKAVVLNSNPDGNLTDRRITNFPAWKDVKIKTDLDANGDKNIVSDNESIESGYWAPRKVPYSLRELEAMIMGNKYNIITQARFVKENFAVTGGLGKRNGENPDDMSNFTSGSLYQLHKNYNFDVANPNTFYNVDGTSTGFDNDNLSVGARAELDDDDWRTPEQKASGHIRYVENYGTSKALSEDQEKYSSSDVYLSAYGDWRYVSDHNRIPILRGEWI